MMGPQWLCDCNVSGSASSVEKAAQGAGRHFLTHGSGESSMSVTVYEDRGKYLWSITTTEQAEKAAHPLMQVSPVLATITANINAMAEYFEELAATLNPRPTTEPVEQITFQYAQGYVSTMLEEAMWTRTLTRGPILGLVSGI